MAPEISSGRLPFLYLDVPATPTSTYWDRREVVCWQSQSGEEEKREKGGEGTWEDAKEMMYRVRTGEEKGQMRQVK
jgi:hypothetical protein